MWLACAIYAIVALGVGLVIGRKLYFWLAWNLLLAVISLALSSVALAVHKIKPVVMGLLLVIWLLFLPNAFYVTTDLVHLSRTSFYTTDGVTFVANYHQNLGPYVLLLVIFAGAVLGLLAGVASIADIAKLMARKRWSRMASRWVLVVIFVLTGFGLYIGRFLRLNSWDVWNPVGFLGVICANFDWFTLQISGLFAIFVAAAYLFYVKVIRHENV